MIACQSQKCPNEKTAAGKGLGSPGVEPKSVKDPAFDEAPAYPAWWEDVSCADHASSTAYSATHNWRTSCSISVRHAIMAVAPPLRVRLPASSFEA